MTSNHTSAPQMPVNEYLEAVWNMYEKQDTSSIIFSNIQSGPIQEKGNQILLEVFFEKIVGHRYKNPSVPYELAKRIAVVEAKKIENFWDTKIVGIRFVEPGESFKPVEYALNNEDFLDNVRSRQAANRDQVSQQAYNSFIQQADSLFQAGRYDLAKPFYVSANSLDPSVSYPVNQIAAIDEIQQNEAQNYAIVYGRAKENEEMRDYPKALFYYEEARKIRPGESSLIDKASEIRQKISIVNRVSSSNSDPNVLLRVFDSEIQAFGNNPDYYMGRAKVFEKMGKSDKALDDYNTTVTIDPNYRPALIGRGDLYDQTGDFSRAAVDYAKALQIFSEDEALIAKLASLYEKQGQVELAVQQLTSAIALAPQNYELYIKRGRLYQRLKDAENAIKDFSQASNIKQASPEPYFLRGQAYIDNREVFNAATDFQEARNRGLDESGEAMILQFFTNFMAEARQAYNQGNYDASIEKYTYALELDGENLMALFERGKANYASGDLLSAIDDLDQAINGRPDWVEAYFIRGQSNLELDDSRSAIQDFNKTLELDQNYYRAYVRLGDLFFGKQQYAEAKEKYEQALDINSNLPEVYFSMGKIEYFTENYVKAIRTLRRAKGGNRNSPFIRYYLGMSYLKAGYYDDAELELSDAVSKKANYALAHWSLGTIFYNRGRVNPAWKSFNQAVTFNPLLKDSLEVRLQLAYTQMHRNELADANQHLDAAAKISSEPHPDVLMAKAIMGLKNGFRSVRDQFEKAKALGAIVDLDKEILAEKFVKKSEEKDVLKYLRRFR